MKYIKYTIILIAIIAGTSCSDWLDVKPISEIDGQEQINSADGFQEILDGAYIGLSNQELYGKELSYGLMESVALNHYDPYDPLQKWDYKAQDGMETIDEVFMGSYSVIANLNFLLDNIDDKEDLFTDEHFIFVKSEAKAIRAFLHFDMLRAFAQNYINAPSELAIPYVTSYDKKIYPHIPADSVVSLILEDLDFAEENLESVEPLVGKTTYDFYSDPELSNRKYRFNYYSILAIKARVYQYTGQYELASTYAQKVIDEYPFEWVQWWNVADDKTFSTENVLALSVFNLAQDYLTDFSNDNYVAGDSEYEYARDIFDVKTGGVGANDVRFQYLFKLDKYGNKNISSKYENKDNPMIPLIKISEMYLILAENLIKTDINTAVEMINTVRTVRSVQTISQGISEDELLKEIVKEFRKDTYLEGQIFYMYKRLQYTEIPAMNPWGENAEINSSDYIFPMPESEIEFGYGSRN